jgi:hypothetical protein
MRIYTHSHTYIHAHTHTYTQSHTHTHTGTVITTGNTEDIVFKNIQLEGLTIAGAADLGFDQSKYTYINFGSSSRITGCFNMFPGDRTAPGTEKTQLCAIRQTGENTLTLPDVSGTVLTTGNLLKLPAMTIPTGHVFVGGNTSFQGALKLGDASTTTTASFYSWVDGTVGLNFASAGSIPASAMGINVGLPVLGGVDIAIRHFMASGDVYKVAVDVQGFEAFRSPALGSSMINISTCHSLMRDARVVNFHALERYMVDKALVKSTLLEGKPYAGIIAVGGFVNLGRVLCVRVCFNVYVCIL